MKKLTLEMVNDHKTPLRDSMSSSLLGYAMSPKMFHALNDRLSAHNQPSHDRAFYDSLPNILIDTRMNDDAAESYYDPVLWRDRCSEQDAWDASIKSECVETGQVTIINPVITDSDSKMKPSDTEKTRAGVARTIVDGLYSRASDYFFGMTPDPDHREKPLAKKM